MRRFVLGWKVLGLEQSLCDLEIGEVAILVDKKARTPRALSLLNMPIGT
jgi:hypothetical protein